MCVTLRRCAVQRRTHAPRPCAARDELVQALLALGQDVTSEDATELMRSYGDADGSGTISYKEFRRMVKDKMRQGCGHAAHACTPGHACSPTARACVCCRAAVGLSAHELVAAFQQFDVDGSESVSAAELDHVLAERLNIRLHGREVEALLSLLDRNGNGEIDVAEFRVLGALMKHSASAWVARGGWPALMLARAPLQCRRAWTRPRAALCSRCHARRACPSVRCRCSLSYLQLRHGGVPDPEDFLVAFLGMPASFRRPITAALAFKVQHSLEYIIRPHVSVRNGACDIGSGAGTPVSDIAVTAAAGTQVSRSTTCWAA